VQHAQTKLTNPMGYFATEALADGRWHARAEHGRYAPSRAIEFVVGGSQPLPIVLFPLREGATLRAQLRDAAKNPVRRATVTVAATDGWTVTLREAAAGAYESELALPEGDLVIRATAEGFPPVEQKFDVKPGEAKTLELTLASASKSP
jgi:nitrogen fixation protein FixH